MAAIIRTEDLTKSYRGKPALIDLTLEVPPGVVFGYLGPNGAGKTTTIRLLAGLIRPTRGTAAIAGIDTVRERAAAQHRIGYLPGEFVAYPDLTAEQYLTYLGNVRGGVSPKTRTRFCERLELDPKARIGAMSHGNRQKVGIVQAFMSEPELLVLDEPTAGLDPLVQREFHAMIREVKADGRSVFLSSHVLSEVQEVADSVGILRQGRLVEVRSVAELTAQPLRRLDLVFDGAPPDLDTLRRIPGVRTVRGTGRAVHVEIAGPTAELLRTVAPYGVDDIVSREPDLEEIFLTYYGRN
ncbi:MULTISPECIES: ABC transporter ATP-binding protein [unclassified Nocardia]|uniref:ABC transporter ATP-binding protein n=1 Tax=unclassified Nocardia TaxID=2637762 RepID=UPI001CE3D5F2|nr:MULTISPECIES: ABC transporter ATP-binding protein [unclassified Nocardia]